MLENILSWCFYHLYFIVLMLFLTFNLITIKTTIKNFKLIATHVGISMFFWLVLTYICMNFYGQCAWNFEPISIFNISFLNIQLEDYLFYFLCIWSMDILLANVNYSDSSGKYYNLSLFVILLTMLTFGILDLFALIVSLIIAIFAIVLYFKTFKYYNVKILLLCTSIFLFGYVWDLWATAIKKNIWGVTEWYYVNNDIFFNSYLWILNTPVSILYFQIAGIFFCTNLFMHLKFDILKK